jgi:hypothetical protein
MTAELYPDIYADRETILFPTTSIPCLHLFSKETIQIKLINQLFGKLTALKSMATTEFHSKFNLSTLWKNYDHYNWQNSPFLSHSSPYTILSELLWFFTSLNFATISFFYRLYGLVVRFSEKQWVWNGVHSASWVQLRSYSEEVVAPV